MKKTGAKQKAIYLHRERGTRRCSGSSFRTSTAPLAYNGSADYSVIRQFKGGWRGADFHPITVPKGFNLEEAAFIIHYDLPYNTLKLEQRIDRCHRPIRENDVLSVAFIDKEQLCRCSQAGAGQQADAGDRRCLLYYR